MTIKREAENTEKACVILHGAILATYSWGQFVVAKENVRIVSAA